MNEISAGDSGEGVNAGADNGVIVNTINQVFALFRINYHNQFYSAFSDTQLLQQAAPFLQGVL